MGVYIKDMEMPKDCIVCPFGWNGCNKQHDFVYMGSRPDNCPLVPVPPHGRLIDADSLMNEFKILQSGREIFGMELDSSFLDSSQEISTEWYRVEETLEDAPTIIEAEEGET